MKTITLHNPSDKDILNYPISEIEFDAEGKEIILNDNKRKETGRTLEWTIKAGETLAFPEYVGNYLKSIYDFLEVKEVEEIKETVEEKPEIKIDASKIMCATCGKSFKNLKGLGLHKAFNHPEELVR